jgi:hypothetical protein
MILRFRHGSTTTEWQFEGIDGAALRRMLQELDVYAVAPDSGEAVLEAQDGDGSTIGAWSRGGAAHLAAEMFRERKTPPWSDVEGVIQASVMDPHPEGEGTPAT